MKKMKTKPRRQQARRACQAFTFNGFHKGNVLCQLRGILLRAAWEARSAWEGCTRLSLVELICITLEKLY